MTRIIPCFTSGSKAAPGSPRWPSAWWPAPPTTTSSSSFLYLAASTDTNTAEGIEDSNSTTARSTSSDRQQPHGEHAEGEPAAHPAARWRPAVSGICLKRKRPTLTPRISSISGTRGLAQQVHRSDDHLSGWERAARLSARPRMAAYMSGVLQHHPQALLEVLLAGGDVDAERVQDEALRDVHEDRVGRSLLRRTPDR